MSEQSRPEDPTRSVEKLSDLDKSQPDQLQSPDDEPGQSLEEKIEELERKQRISGFAFYRFHQLVQLKVQLKQQEGMSLLQAKEEAYEEAIEDLEADERLFGSKKARSMKYQYQHALDAIGLSDEPNPEDDPILREVHGAKVNFLSKKDVEDLWDDLDKYQDLAEAIDDIIKQHGSHPDLKDLYWAVRGIIIRLENS